MINSGVRARFLLVTIVAFATTWLFASPAQARSDFVDDPEFAGNGLVTRDVGPVDLSATLAPQVFARDGRRRVIVGAASGPEWHVWRILPNGQLDPSFGDQGEVVIADWAGLPGFPSANLTSAVIRPDHRILLVGYVGSYPVGDIRTGIATMVMKQLLPDGSPDESFGQEEGGKRAGSRNGAARVALRADGGFFVGAFKQRTETGRTDDGALFSFTANGRMNRDFGPGENVNGVNILGAPHKPSYVFDVEVLPDGRILVTGVSKNRLLLTRLHKDGSRDLSFGKGGQVIMQKARVTTPRDMERDKKGRILLAGFVYPKDPKKADYGMIMRFSKNGRLDRSFGNRGAARLYATPRKGEGSTRLYDVTIDPKGGILVTGSAGQSARNQRRAIVARYLPNGKKDPRFFKKGILKIRLGDGSTGSATIRSGRKIYMSGRYDHGDQERFFLKRFKLRG